MEFSQLFQDGINGTLSSRRVITVLSFLLCAVAFIANLFFGLTIEKFIFDSMSYIAIAGMGATVAEKFSGAEKVRMDDRYNYHQPQMYNQYPSTAPMRGSRLPDQNDPLI